MFVSIVMPKAKHDKVILTSSLLSCIVSVLLFYIPFLSEHITSGFAIIIAAVAAALTGVIVRDKLSGKQGTIIAAITGVILIVCIVILAPSYKAPEVASITNEGISGALDNKIFVPLLITMAVTTYLVRMIPFTLFRKKLEKPSVKAFFDYIPYTVLSAMTFPAILYATGSVISAAIGFAVALVLGFFERSLIVVAVGACLASLVAGVIMMYI